MIDEWDLLKYLLILDRSKCNKEPITIPKFVLLLGFSAGTHPKGRNHVFELIEKGIIKFHSEQEYHGNNHKLYVVNSGKLVDEVAKNEWTSEFSKTLKGRGLDLKRLKLAKYL